MASEPKTIEVKPGGELDRVLNEAQETPVRLVRGDDRFRLDRESDDIWESYDPALARESTLAFSGAWKDLDAEAFKSYIRERRRTGNRPPARW
jgi:hypothetical protein